MIIDKTKYPFVEVGIQIKDERNLDVLISTLVLNGYTVYMSDKNNLKEVVILVDSDEVYDCAYN